MILSIPTRNFSTFGKGLGTTAQLQQAQALLQQSGYSGVECHEERVSFPGIDPQTGLNYYVQQICTAPGFTGGFTVENVLNSTLNTPGRGVNLAAERAYLIGTGNDGRENQGGYAFADSPGTIITNAIDTQGKQRVIPPVQAPSSSEYLRAFDSRAANLQTTPAPSTAAVTLANTSTQAAAAPKGASAAGVGFDFSLDNPVVLYGLLGVGALIAVSMVSK